MKLDVASTVCAVDAAAEFIHAVTVGVLVAVTDTLRRFHCEWSRTAMTAVPPIWLMGTDAVPAEPREMTLLAKFQEL
jgi:hypothetical protein